MEIFYDNSLVEWILLTTLAFVTIFTIVGWYIVGFQQEQIESLKSKLPKWKQKRKR